MLETFFASAWLASRSPAYVEATRISPSPLEFSNCGDKFQTTALETTSALLAVLKLS